MWPLLAGMAGPAMGFLGQLQTNATNSQNMTNTNAANMAEASRNRDFQAGQSTQQMAFQERMANTAYQRQAEDMRKAGINPMGANMSGAATPAGASASGSQGSAQSVKLDNPMAALEGIGTSALSAMKTAADIDNVRMATKVASKSVPEADIKNKAYDWFSKKVKGWLETKKPKEQSFGVHSYNPKTRKFRLTNP